MLFYLYVITKTKLQPSRSEPNTTCDYSVKMNEKRQYQSQYKLCWLPMYLVAALFLSHNDKMAYHHLMLISIRVCDGTLKIQLKSQEKHLDDSSNVTRICILPTFKLTHTKHWKHKKNSLVNGLYFPVWNYCLLGCLSVWMFILSVTNFDGNIQ